MASALLDALMGTQRSAASDPYGIIASGIGQAAPALVNPYASTGTNLGLTLGAGLLSGLLGGIAQKRADEENASAMSQSLQMFGLTDPAKRIELIQQNPRLAGVEAAIRASELEQRAELAKEERKAKLELQTQTGAKLAGVLIDQGYVPQGDTLKVDADGNPVRMFDPAAEEARKAGLVEEAKLGAATKAGNVGPNDKEKYIDSLRQEFIKQPEYQEFSKASTAYQTIIKAASDPRGVSDLDAVYGAIQMIEPGMAVREGEQAAVRNSQSIPENLKGAMLKAMNGEAGLTKDVRDAIIDLAARRYDQYREKYNALTEGYAQRALKLTGIEKPSISFLPDPGTGAALYESLKTAPYGVTPGATQVGGANLKALSDEQLNQLIQQKMGSGDGLPHG